MNEPVVIFEYDGVTATLRPDSKRMFDLQELWRFTRLPNNKNPSRWITQKAEALVNEGKLLKVRGVNGGIKGHVDAVRAYAEWCGTSIHRAVCEAVAEYSQYVHSIEIPTPEVVKQKIEREILRATNKLEHIAIAKAKSGHLRLIPEYCTGQLIDLSLRALIGVTAKSCRDRHDSTALDYLWRTKGYDGWLDHLAAIHKMIALVTVGANYDKISKIMASF